MKNKNISAPIIYETLYHNFDKEHMNGLSELRERVNSEEKDNTKYIVDYPTVYVIKGNHYGDKYKVYVGETNNIYQRTQEHLNDDSKKQNRQDWHDLGKDKDAWMYVIGHNHFNKSLTLDIENQMMLYLSSSDAVGQLINQRGNDQNEYYTSDERDQIFTKIWNKLHKKDTKLFPPMSLLKDSAIFKISPFHKLMPKQKQAKQDILAHINAILSNEDEQHQLILVEGEAGTGKTVLPSNLLYDLVYRMDERLDVRLFVRHNEQKKVYQEIAKKLDLTYKDGENKKHSVVVDHPVSFITHDDQIDVALIDEAHLLLTQNNRGYSAKNDHITDNQLHDIMQHAKLTVAIIDAHQFVAREGLNNLEEIDTLRKKATYIIPLKEQLRMNASHETNDWIKNFIYNGDLRHLPKDDQYEVKAFTNPEKLLVAIKEKDANQDNGISRLVATYDWKYKDSKPNPDDDQGYWQVEIGKKGTSNYWKKPWNYQLPRAQKNTVWAEDPVTINEIGSIYTIQGFDLNYCGVIIGPSFKYRNGKVIVDPSATQNDKTSIKNDPEMSRRLIRNGLNVLMTRGVKGLYIYACDDALREKLLEMIG